MVNVFKEGVLIGKTELGFECEGVLNPGIIQDRNGIHLFYRAVAKGNYSTIGYCKLQSPLIIEKRNDAPLLFPQQEYESHGMEDPRIVKIDDTFYLTYTAYDGINALGALATSLDLVNWQKWGIMVPQITKDEFKYLSEIKGKINEKYLRYNQARIGQDHQELKVLLWDKNLVFFPRKINDKFCFLHRIKPDIQIVVSIDRLEDLTEAFWQQYFLHFNDYIVLTSKYDHEVSYIGAGCPPIETKAGWLIIYHGVHDTTKGYVYSACAALFDLEIPQKEIARLPYPLFFPEKEWELKGEVNNVCFPTGALVEGDKLFIYYGAADERIAVASMNMNELMNELLLNTV